MTRIALISDIHANEVALRAVLADIERRGVDQTVCLGDVADLGPHPKAVVEILGTLGCPCILGNHDEFLLEPELVRSYSTIPRIVASVDWSRDQLSGAELDFLRGFQSGLDIELGGGAFLQLFHGTPRSNQENLFATTPPDQVDEMLGGRTATVMAGGHTHIQMIRQHDGCLLVNPGSVGMPFKRYPEGVTPSIMSYAEYAIVEESAGAIGVNLCRVPIDKDKLRRANSEIDHPMRDALLRHYS
jgi:putative phosphoesterase